VDLLPQQLRAALPFTLTAAQERCVAEISADLAQTAPMHRLLQGDVGSGKTVVAALAAAQAMAAGWQCAIMAPTEILAAQHARKLADWLEPLGVGVAWLSGSQSRKEREIALQRVASGQAQLVLGTHAVIQAQVRFARLGLAIVDEQHRFGVAQRLALRDSLLAGTQGSGLQPHLLMMSATPIPRTLAMALFGDLDVSTIDSLPPGRTPVRTTVVSAERRDDLIERVGGLIAQGRQAYWVCPLVEESETLDLQNAVATHAELSAALAAVPGQTAARVGLLHGRMKAGEKRATMQAFSAGEIGLLVATTVIEVGVDVPNASLMVIEHAERFGLSQLHQLRGRVGRGAAQSDCVLLFSSPLSPAARERLAAMRELADGFALAQKDLELRGPGELLGLRQSGVPGLRYADLAHDADLLEAARDTAQRLLHSAPEAARQHVARWLGEGFDWLSA
ncbi:MAG: ATP-dependent DNA helicase RecG, partial [Thiomonas sp.]|nr:ATP-dependent DNA helicase RecG [Thiomonas sp.]